MLGEVQDAKAYITGLEVSPTERCSFLEGLRIKPLSSGHLDLAAKGLWRASACFHEAMCFTSLAYNKWFRTRLSAKLLT